MRGRMAGHDRMDIEPRWRNWQTRTTQNRVPSGSEGSIPSLGTIPSFAMFLDEAHITVSGGKGGDGIVSWRKEKYVPRGGPWGGDGGNGGNVIIRAAENVDTLTTFAERKVFNAQDGGNGMTARKHGKNGEDTVLLVPPGTVIYSQLTAHSSQPLADLVNTGDEYVVAKGGRGGYGNAHFASSVRQAPDFAEKGEPGETKSLTLELKLVAEVGIIGLPSVGKSTLISVISNAKPKIAEYPFTTLVPNLGVVTVHDRSFIVCDVPGLIEGASEGKGLGDQFLRHIERCGVLVHLLDVNREDLAKDYQTIREELERFSLTLATKRELVVLNKTDLIKNDAALFTEELKKNDIEVFASISAATQHGVEEFLNELLPIVLEERSHRASLVPSPKSQVPTLKPATASEKTGAFQIEEEDGIFIVRGKRIEQIAQMTDWGNKSAIQRFRDIVERSGLRTSLMASGADEQSTVQIGDVDVSQYWL